MSTTVTKIQTKWDSKKTQEHTAKMAASMALAAYEVLSKAGAKAHEEFSNIMVEHKIAHYKQLGVKTPLELVTAMAEADHNMFGSDVEVSGDDKKATVKFNTCGMWNAMQHVSKLTEEQQAKMGESCAASSTKLADAFGFKFESSKDKNDWSMTFSK